MGRTGPITRDASTVQLGLSQIRVAPADTYIATATPALTNLDSMGAMASTAFTSETEYWDLESGFPLALDATYPLRETNMLECAFREISPKNLAIARGMNPFANISATALKIASTTTLGTDVPAKLTIDNAGGAVTDTFTVVFTSATAFDVYGMASGNVGSGTISVNFAPDNGGNPYFTIESGHFTGTWAADDTFTFVTTAYQAGTSAYADNHVGSIPLGNLAAPKYLRVESVYTFPNPAYEMVIIFPRANITSSLNLEQQPEDSAAVTMSIKAMGASEDTAGGHAAWNTMPNGQILFRTVS